MSFDHIKYPKNWKEFSRRIRFERAKNRCEVCGIPNYSVGHRNGDKFEFYGGNLYLDETSRGKNGFAESKQLLEFLLENSDDETRPTLIVLTVAHLDNFGDICVCEQTTGQKCVNENHVLAMCQKCHLDYDSERHKFNARRSRAERMNQQWLADWDARFER